MARAVDLGERLAAPTEVSHEEYIRSIRERFDLTLERLEEFAALTATRWATMGAAQRQEALEAWRARSFARAVEQLADTAARWESREHPRFEVRHAALGIETYWDEGLGAGDRSEFGYRVITSDDNAMRDEVSCLQRVPARALWEFERERAVADEERRAEAARANARKRAEVEARVERERAQLVARARELGLVLVEAGVPGREARAGVASDDETGEKGTGE